MSDKLTIRRAWYANAEQTAICIDTEEYGSVMRSTVDSTPEDWAAALAAKPSAYVPPDAPTEADPVDKIREFLSANPDVARLVG